MRQTAGWTLVTLHNCTSFWEMQTCYLQRILLKAVIWIVINSCTDYSGNHPAVLICIHNKVEKIYMSNFRVPYFWTQNHPPVETDGRNSPCSKQNTTNNFTSPCMNVWSPRKQHWAKPGLWGVRFYFWAKEGGCFPNPKLLTLQLQHIPHQMLLRRFISRHFGCVFDKYSIFFFILALHCNPSLQEL